MKPTAPIERSLRLLPDDDLRFLRRGFESLLPVGSGTEPHLRAVLLDSLSHPGSLVRAQVSYSIQRGCGIEAEPARRVSVGIEYFHTASLIFDDLPCMDNARERRGHVCPHILYGEAAATLGALALITQAYALLWEGIRGLPPSRMRVASGLVAECLGIDGILNGQARDLHFAVGPRDETEVLNVAQGKTGTLIRLSLVLPAVIGGAGRGALAALEKLSAAWGLAYQIVDDFKDVLAGPEESGKTAGRDRALDRPNLPEAAGRRAAARRLSKLLAEARPKVEALAREGSAWSCLGGLQARLEAEDRAIQRRLFITACA